MEQMINIVISITSTICLSLMTNYIYDKLKSHSVRESGLEIKIKLKFFELNFKSEKR
ncbi:hypothetical protein [Terrisporobacter muris]|uniref:Uncharacterized protein n=1 Tax=Terrisporobacter muris TaxID=2963284 RepID=A0A9X2MAE5_9FIRM|nr:hypothetical protein [Terrisporobacter muris]MCR1823807.1 hypothetical protein [Terrisporobacter muris]